MRRKTAGVVVAGGLALAGIAVLAAARHWVWTPSSDHCRAGEDFEIEATAAKLRSLYLETCEELSAKRLELQAAVRGYHLATGEVDATRGDELRSSAAGGIRASLPKLKALLREKEHLARHLRELEPFSSPGAATLRETARRQVALAEGRACLAEPAVCRQRTDWPELQETLPLDGAAGDRTLVEAAEEWLAGVLGRGAAAP